MSQDRPAIVRHVAVTVASVVCVVGSLIGVGVLGGTPIAEAAGGVLSTTTAGAAVTAVAVVTIVVRLRTGAETRVGRQERTT